MGNNQSVGPQRIANYTHANHVIKVTPGSPGERGGLVPFFDYLVEANGVLLDKDNVLIDFLSVSTGKEIKFVVYNSKREDYRETIITPSDWNGQSKLGVSVRFTEIRPNMMEFVWHILEISRNSPASEAGLIADYDYIIGTTKSPFTDSEDFFNLVSRNHLKPLELYVYNIVTDKVRIITLTPNPSWGGNGCLGCEIGFGLLHRIPSEDTRKNIIKKYEEEVPKPEPFPDYPSIKSSPPPRQSENLVISHIPPHSFASNNQIINNNLINKEIPQNPIIQSQTPTPIAAYQPAVLNQIPVTNPVVNSPVISQAPVTPNLYTPNPNAFSASPYYPQISSPYKPPTPSPSTPLPTNLQSPLSPIANSPSLETLQRLKEKQALLQEQLKSIQLSSPAPLNLTNNN